MKLPGDKINTKMPTNRQTQSGAGRRGKDQVTPNSPILNDYGKMPPNDVKLEDTVIGALLIGGSEAYGLVSDVLKPESFYHDRNRYIYEAMLASQQQPIDFLSVTEQLKREGHLDGAGGELRIAELTSQVSTWAHVEYHAAILSRKYLARQLISFATNVEKKAYDNENDIDEVMQQAEGALFEISQKNLKRSFSKIDPIINESFAQIQLAANQTGLSGVPSGFDELDKITSGWQKSDLIIVAARPAMGKTAFVLSMIKNMGMAMHAVALFSLEMSNIQLVNRLLVNVSGVSNEKIKTGTLSEQEWTQLNAKSRELFGKPIYFDDTPSLSIFEFNTKARRLVKEHSVECIFIDYLQLMNASGMNYGSREQEVSMISRSLKQMAKELNIPIIALSQLNRGVEGRVGEDKRPQLADLRESGAIEQDADMVLFIHRPEYYKITETSDGVSTRGLAEIIIAKHRNGATGTVRLRFISQQAKFTNFDTSDFQEIESSLDMGSGVSAGMSPVVAPVPDDPMPNGDTSVPF